WFYIISFLQFNVLNYRKDIPIHILDNESYEKDSVFYVEIGEPKLEEDLIKEETGQINNEPSSPNGEASEADKLAMLGKPRLGEYYRCQIRIKESREFKNTVDKLFEKANVSLMIGTSSWREQFLGVITVNTGDEDDEEEDDGTEKMPSCSDYVIHFFTIFWKVLFAFIPPTG
ncbi:sodium/calcium exchanger 2-like, partial [Centruroides sculpturatus]|uniref:sodium/calcium exchanger 2-like n=1 Tax=Centruroides sculpturatus TaxID=218467 RepID=UPI000C6E099F